MNRRGTGNISVASRGGVTTAIETSVFAKKGSKPTVLRTISTEEWATRNFIDTKPRLALALANTAGIRAEKQRLAAAAELDESAAARLAYLEKSGEQILRACLLHKGGAAVPVKPKKAEGSDKPPKAEPSREDSHPLGQLISLSAGGRVIEHSDLTGNDRSAARGVQHKSQLAYLTVPHMPPTPAEIAKKEQEAQRLVTAQNVAAVVGAAIIGYAQSVGQEAVQAEPREEQPELDDQNLLADLIPVY